MARRKRSHRRKGFTLPVAAIAGFAPLAGGLIERASWPNAGQEIAKQMSRTLVGYDYTTGQFNWRWLSYGTFPIIAGLAVHKFVGGRLGVNRMLASAGVPLIRL